MAAAQAQLPRMIWARVENRPPAAGGRVSETEEQTGVMARLFGIAGRLLGRGLLVTLDRGDGERKRDDHDQQ